MYTLCPECKKTIPVSVEQLRESRGMLQCDACQTKFDALEFLSENAENNLSPPPSEDAFLPSQKKPAKNHSPLWLTGILAGLLLLALQIIYFEGEAFAQKPTLRPWLEKICQQLNCQLPPYRNLNEIHILETTLDSKDPGRVVFNIVLTNQADFPQPNPNLKLTLVDYQGKIFAQRVFSADNYHPSSTQLKPGQTVKIQLVIVKPGNPVGGYRFSLL